MGHSKLHLAIIMAGFATVGAVFGHTEPKAEAAPIIVLDEVVILACEADEPASSVAAACGTVDR